MNGADTTVHVCCAGARAKKLPEEQFDQQTQNPTKCACSRCSASPPGAFRWTLRMVVASATDDSMLAGGVEYRVHLPAVSVRHLQYMFHVAGKDLGLTLTVGMCS